MISALVLLAFIVNTSCQCGDDMVPISIPAGKLPAEWNVGTIPHLFLNSEHLRGVLSMRDFKISGLDSVSLSLKFCPPEMTIYGDLSATRLQTTGHYTGNVDYLKNGKEVLIHGQGFLNSTFRFQLRNLVAPLRYSSVVKRLQIDKMQYEASEEVFNPQFTGVHVDGVGEHDLMSDELIQIDMSNGSPTMVEIMRAVINSRVKDGILLAAVKEMFQSAFLF